MTDDNVDETFDLDALDEYLMSDQAPDDCMQLSDLDGFLTAIAISPSLIKPSEWMPVIWRDEEPDFASDDEALKVMNAIVGRHNEIVYQIENTPDEYVPIFWQSKDDVVIAMDWAEGFMEGVQLAMDDWVPLMQTEQGQDMLLPILAFLNDDEGNPIVEGTPKEVAAIYDEMTEKIAPAVLAIDSYFKKARRN